MKLSSKLMMQWLSSILQSHQSYQFYLPKNVSLLLLLSIPLTSTLLQALISSCPNYYHDLQSCCPFIHLPRGHWYNFIKHAAAKSLQSCPTLCDPIDGSPPGPPSLGFSRQEHWSATCIKMRNKEVKVSLLMTLSLMHQTCAWLLLGLCLYFLPLPLPTA